SSPVLVDTTKPADAFSLTSVSGGVSKSGTTIYYKGNTAGSFKLRDTVTDGTSGPASATFGLLSGGSGFSAHSSETVSTPAGGPPAPPTTRPRSRGRARPAPRPSPPTAPTPPATARPTPRSR